MAKQEKYDLQRLLEMRERAREEAGLYLAECRRQLSIAENELEKRKQAVIDCRQAQNDAQQQLTEKASGGMKSGEIARYRAHLIYLREQETQLLAAVAEQQRAVERAAQTVEKALGALQEAAKETKVIEKHRENWQLAKRIETTRREQKTNDEIGGLLHDRRRFE